MSNDFLQYLDSIDFFSPTEGLVKRLTKRIDIEKRKDLDQVMQDTKESSFSIDASEVLGNENYTASVSQKVFDPEDDLDLIKVEYLSWLKEDRPYLQQIKTNQAFDMKPLETSKTDSVELSRFISEQIYHLLASASREKEAKEGHKLSISKIFSEEDFSEILGLPEDEPLLNELIEEFNLWIKRIKGSFITDWGEIISCGGDNFYLTPYYDW